MTDMDFSALKGLTLTEIDTSPPSREGLVRFTTLGGRVFELYHRQGCCESVSLEDVVGELDGLLGHPLLMAEEVQGDGYELSVDGKPASEHWGTFTWTYYKLATIKGYVTLRFYGESNGSYSEEVDFREVSVEEPNAVTFLGVITIFAKPRTHYTSPVAQAVPAIPEFAFFLDETYRIRENVLDH